ncbi:phage exclusion protein [Escherichia coli O145:H28]|nr:phage exclusion protein [Escherichia coli O145:H28]GEH09069.1 phage exclusion protein [Escherichia coli O145:H28]
MAKVFTQEEREKIKGQVVELVRRSGRETLRQLEAKTGATRYLMSVLARELVEPPRESWRLNFLRKR